MSAKMLRKPSVYGQLQQLKGMWCFCEKKKEKNYYPFLNLEVVPFLSFLKGYHSFENDKLKAKSWSSEWSL